MSSHDEDADVRIDPDLELLTDYLAKELDPAQVAEVERRLASDDKFRELAAPLLAVWLIQPPPWQRKPMPRAEVERNWVKLSKRGGWGSGGGDSGSGS